MENFQIKRWCNVDVFWKDTYKFIGHDCFNKQEGSDDLMGARNIHLEHIFITC